MQLQQSNTSVFAPVLTKLFLSTTLIPGLRERPTCMFGGGLVEAFQLILNSGHISYLQHCTDRTESGKCCLCVWQIASTELLFGHLRLVHLEKGKCYQLN